MPCDKHSEHQMGESPLHRPTEATDLSNWQEDRDDLVQLLECFELGEKSQFASKAGQRPHPRSP